MILKFIYSDSTQKDIFEQLKNLHKDITCVGYDYSHFKEKKDAFKVMNFCGTKLVPFCAIYNDKKEVVKAFYSEVSECTFNDINNYLNDKFCYNSASN